MGKNIAVTPISAEHDLRTDLKVWLRLLGCTGFIQREIAGRLRARFGVSLARFDYLAQLDRAGPEGLTMGALGEKLMVTGGNITGLTDRLAAEGLVERMPDPNDRRIQRIKLTDAGRSFFTEMARVHAGWIEEIVSGLTSEETDDLLALLGRLKTSARRAVDRHDGEGGAR